MTEECSKSQLGLLILCQENPGPNIKELFEFAPYYGIPYNSIIKDYPILLIKKLVWPVGGIDHGIYLPTHCLITEKGIVLINKTLQQKPEMFSLSYLKNFITYCFHCFSGLIYSSKLQPVCPEM